MMAGLAVAAATTASGKSKLGNKSKVMKKKGSGKKCKGGGGSFLVEASDSDGESKEGAAPAAMKKRKPGKVAPASSKVQKRAKKGAEDHPSSNGEDESDESGDEEEDAAEGQGEAGKSKKRNKNAPLEVSSKIPVSRGQKNIFGGPKYKPLDPRFSDVTGDFNKTLHNRNYAFLKEYAEEEESALSRALRKVRNKEKKASLKEELTEMRQDKAHKNRTDRVHEIRQGFKREQNKKMKEGKTPFYIKKKDEKLIGLGARYLELKKQGKVKKFVEKKRKQKSNKDHKWMPRSRGDDPE